MMALFPSTVQNMPDCLSRDPITVLQAASITPEPTKTLLAEFWILNSVSVPFEVVGFNAKSIQQFWFACWKATEFGDHAIDLALVQFSHKFLGPAFALLSIGEA